MVCKDSKLVYDGFIVLFQVTFIFAFLTTFYFVYVVNVEKEEFSTQIGIIIDKLLSNNISNIVPANLTSAQKQQLAIAISGAVSVANAQNKISSKSDDTDQVKKNNKTRKIAFGALSGVVLLLVLLTIIAIFLGYCMPIKTQIMEALWIILFVGITEFIFLNIIAKNYISANPNTVSIELGNAIQKYIKTLNKSPSK